MKELNKARIKKAYRKAMDNAFEILGNDVTVYVRTTKTSVEFDDVFNEPVDPDDTAYNTRVVKLNGIARWNTAETLRRMSAGTVYEEELYLTVKSDEVLINQSIPSQGTIFENADEIVVDGLSCKLKRTPQRLGIDTPYTVFVVLERSA